MDILHPAKDTARGIELDSGDIGQQCDLPLAWDCLAGVRPDVAIFIYFGSENSLGLSPDLLDRVRFGLGGIGSAVGQMGKDWHQIPHALLDCLGTINRELDLVELG